MTDMSAQVKSAQWTCAASRRAWCCAPLVIGLTAFLTVVDLFATQAILPSLTRHYDVTPAAMGFAVNASTMGMAVAGLVVGFLQPADRSPARHSRQPRRLSVPTALLASAPDLTTFTHPARRCRASAWPRRLR